MKVLRKKPHLNLSGKVTGLANFDDFFAPCLNFGLFKEPSFSRVLKQIQVNQLELNSSQTRVCCFMGFA